MPEIIFARKPVNIELLTEQLQAAFGSRMSGISLRPREIIVHVDETFDGDDQRTAQGIIDAHDDTQRTVQQQARLDRENARLQARDAASAALDLNDFDILDPALQLLARKVVWLEREIAVRDPGA